MSDTKDAISDAPVVYDQDNDGKPQLNADELRLAQMGMLPVE